MSTAVNRKTTVGLQSYFPVTRGDRRNGFEHTILLPAAAYFQRLKRETPNV